MTGRHPICVRDVAVLPDRSCVPVAGVRAE